VLRNALCAILAEYRSARTFPFAGNKIADTFHTATESVRAVVGHSYKIVSSRGQGQFAEIPWIGIRRPAVAENFQSGIYVIYLFRSDMSGVYLSLAIGIERLARSGIESASAVAPAIKKAVHVPPGFTTGIIDLHSRSSRAARYRDSVVISQLYEASTMPPEATLSADLSALMSSYDGVRSLRTYSNVMA
jgi:5-methylcytosine-specific restriction protein A